MIRHHLEEPSTISEIFGRDYGLQFDLDERVAYYRPLFVLLGRGLFRLLGPSAFGFHAVALAVFAASCALLTVVTSRALGGNHRSLALGIGCLAAVHSVRTEFAVFFTTMPDVMIEIFGLLTVSIALSLFGPTRPSLRWFVLGVLGLAAGLTKESSFFIFPSIALTLCLAGLWSRNDRPRLWDGLSILVGISGSYVIRIAGGVGLPADANPMIVFGVGANRALDGLIEGVRNLIIPGKTVFVELATPPALPGSALAVILVFGLSTVLILHLLRRGLLFAALMSAWVVGGFFCLMLICARDLAFCDRYVPSGATIILLGLLANYVWSRTAMRSVRWGAAPTLLFAGYLAVFAVFGWLSTLQCRSPMGFFLIMADDHPESGYPRLLLANMMFMEYNDLDGAVNYLREAVEIDPHNARARATAVAVARRLIDANESRRGLDALEWSTKGMPETAEIWNLRARCQAGLRDFGAALQSMDRAIELAPERAELRKHREEISAAKAMDESGRR